MRAMRKRRAAVYEVRDRLHDGRCRLVHSDQIVPTVSDWLAELGVHTPLVDDLARAVCDGDWAAAHAVGDMLGVDISPAA
jgi:hypothetical protein